MSRRFKSFPPIQSLRSKILVGLLIVILVNLIVRIIYVQRNHPGKQTVPEQMGQLASVDMTPSIQGISYTRFSDNQRKYNLRAEYITITDRRYENLIFPAFKDIIISELRVTMESQTISEIMDWASNSVLAPFTALLFFDERSFDPYGVANLTYRVIVEDLRVCLMSKGADTPWVVMSADVMVKQAASSEVIFKGDFSLNFRTGEHLRSSEAKWLSRQGGFYFPTGYLLDGQPRPIGFFTVGHDVAPLRGVGCPVSGAQDLLVKALPHSESREGRPSVQPLSSDFANLETIRKNFRNMDPGIRRSLFWQLLVLNPELFKQRQISPFILLFPNFKLGAFEPGLPGMSS